MAIHPQAIITISILKSVEEKRRRRWRNGIFSWKNYEICNLNLSPKFADLRLYEETSLWLFTSNCSCRSMSTKMCGLEPKYTWRINIVQKQTRRKLFLLRVRQMNCCEHIGLVDRTELCMLRVLVHSFCIRTSEFRPRLSVLSILPIQGS